MKKYRVEQNEVYRVVYEIEAKSEEDALARFQDEGEEISSSYNCLLEDYGEDGDAEAYEV